MRVFINIKNGQSVHLRQGDLDGACAVYSLMMGLIAARKVKKNDLMDLAIVDKVDGRESLGRLIREFFNKIPQSKKEPETVLLRNGYNLASIQNKLAHSFSKEAASNYAQCSDENDEESFLDKNQLLQFITEELDKGYPVEIGCSWKDNGHALLAVGYESSHGELTKLFCLDPGYDCPKRTKYNAVISLMRNGRHTQFHEVMGRRVFIDEALSIEK